MIGIAKRTGIISDATMLTIIDVEVELDCTITVASNPIINL
jgi:hypothetical protein